MTTTHEWLEHNTPVDAKADVVLCYACLKPVARPDIIRIVASEPLYCSDQQCPSRRKPQS